MSKTKQLDERRAKYASLRDAAQKMAMGFQATYLDLPSGVKLWKPKAGTQLIDIIPYRVGKLNPIAEKGQLWWEFTYRVHRGIGADNQTFICPARVLGEPCPICEYREELISEEAEDKLVKKLVPKQRQLLNLIDLKDPESGIQLYETSNFLFGDEITNNAMAGDQEDNWESFFSVEDGLTLKIHFEEDTFEGRTFVRAGRIDFRPRKKAYKESILDEVFDLEKLIKVLEYEKLKAKFFAATTKKSKDDDDEEEEDEVKGRGRDDDDDEDEPKSKRRHRDDDEDEEPADDEDEPKSKRRKRDDDEDEEPAEDEDEEPKSKRRSRDDEDEEEEPADDEDEPKSKRRKKDDDEDEEEEESPKQRKRKSSDDEDEDQPQEEEDEEEPKSKRRKASDEDEDEEPEEDEDEDEGKPKRKVLGKGKSKFEDEEDDGWNDFGEDEEDEDKPKKKARK